MVDFEKIGDTFEEGFDKVKDFTKKNKVLTVAIIGVGAVALIKLYRDKTSQDTEYVSTYAYVPTAYDGYPTMSPSVSYDDVVHQLREETSDIHDKTMSDVSDLLGGLMLENDYDPIIKSESFYGENLTTDSYLEEARKQRKIDQMKKNSEAWYNASESERERLHEENERFGAMLGAEFDSATGQWYLDGQSLYDVPVKNKTNTSTAHLTNVGLTETTVNRSSVISQMKSNSEAWHSASETERKKLEAENQQLGKQIGASYDSNTGLWSDSKGSLYTVSSSSSKKSSSTSTNVRTSSSSGSNTSSVVSQMKANSEAWHSASASEKKNLEAKNQELGKSIGATYNSGDGTWTKSDGSALYD